MDIQKQKKYPFNFLVNDNLLVNDNIYKYK